MPLREELNALRTTTGLAEVSHVVCVRLSGDDAFATLDALVPAPLSLQDTQLRLSVLLREDATVFADVCVARDDEAYFLLSEGPSAEELVTWIRAHAAGPAFEVERYDASHRMLAVHGPWAWELLATCLGPDVMGMPYLSFLRGGSGVYCFRSGKTGEYGYELLVPAAEYETLRAGLLQHGAEFGVVPVGLEALDTCALENWFFCVRHAGVTALTPLELGLQWRVAPGKTFVGSEALAAHRQRGFSSRATCLVLDGPVSPGAPVELEGRVVGRVLSAVESPLLGHWTASALLELPLAVPGVPGLRVGAVTARSVSPPVLHNRSLYVSPQRHTWADRASVNFPALVP